jgi:hypothetical protein
LDQLDPLGKLVTKVAQAKQVHRVQLEAQDTLVPEAQLEMLVLKAPKDPRAHQEEEALTGQLDQLVPQAPQDPEEIKDNKGVKVHRVQLVQKVPKDSRETLDDQDQQDPQALKGKLDQEEMLVLQVHLVLLEPLAPLELLDQQDQLVQQVHLAQMEKEGPLD